MDIRFDDRRRGLSYGFRGRPRVVEAAATADVIPAFEQVEREVAAGRWAVGFVSYEAAPAFDAALTVSARRRPGEARLPLLWFAIFDERFEPAPMRPGAYRVGAWEQSINRATYARSMDRIRRHIAAGDTYQVNYTYRQSALFEGDAQAFYADLLAAQSASYGAYLDTGPFQILSASPELFFHQTGRRIVCRPMKGTSARGRWPEEDRALLAALGSSEKERAENVMIVDLIRNDLGRVAQFGTVHVDELFAAEQYETVWQLVSTVSAQLRPAVGPIDVFGALFPCGSVTGAPKVRTMEIIADLETGPRGVYCGAIGLLAPLGSDGPAASFSVAIRTVTIDREAGTATYGIGGGITHDSQTEREYEETRTKARVLIRKPPAFELIETLRWEPGPGYRYLTEHLDRLQESAEYCGFRMERAEIERHLLAAVPDQAYRPARVRLSLREDGAIDVAVDALLEPDRPLRVVVDHVPVDPADWRLFHKTSMRRRYREARERHPDADDVLMINVNGEITESTIANVIVCIDGNWVTPPISAGCLPGVMRRVMLEAGEIKEAPVLASDLDRAESLALINSVRLRVAAVLIGSEPEPAPGELDE